MALQELYREMKPEQQACVRWLLVQLQFDDFLEMVAQELYADDFERLPDLLRTGVVSEVENIGTIDCSSVYNNLVLDCMSEHTDIETIGDLVFAVTVVIERTDARSKRAEPIRKQRLVDLSDHLRQAFPDTVEELAQEVHRRRQLESHKERRLDHTLH